VPEGAKKETKKNTTRTLSSLSSDVKTHLPSVFRGAKMSKNIDRWGIRLRGSQGKDQKRVPGVKKVVFPENRHPTGKRTNESPRKECRLGEGHETFIRDQRVLKCQRNRQLATKKIKVIDWKQPTQPCSFAQSTGDASEKKNRIGPRVVKKL